nr:unnamed protein product [Spirometra erinaceieuropaei]
MIFTVHQLQQKFQEMRTHLYSTFMDLTKAFDAVNREVLWKIMLHPPFRQLTPSTLPNSLYHPPSPPSPTPPFPPLHSLKIHDDDYCIHYHCTQFCHTNNSSDVDSIHTCPHCGRIFTSHVDLVGYLRIHRTETGEPVPGVSSYNHRYRPYCPLCPRTPAHRIGLVGHMRIHVGEIDPSLDTLSTILHIRHA